MYKSLGALVARSLAISSSKFALVKLFSFSGNRHIVMRAGFTEQPALPSAAIAAYRRPQDDPK
jgi:hypothetical protein